MSVIKRAFSALGKLGIIIAIAIAFFFGLLGTVYYSLRSPEVKVPDVIGKDVTEGEQALDKDGLNMRRRATRFSPDAKPNTILDQSPHAGEIIKAGQTVAVIISRSTAKEGETPVSAAEEKFSTENKNTNEESSSAKNENASENTNANKSNKNRNRNANNSNNSNNSNNKNANNKNANNRNANNSNANNRNTNDRNVNNRNANANRPTSNANTINRNANSNRSNSNSNGRTP